MNMRDKARLTLLRQHEARAMQDVEALQRDLSQANEQVANATRYKEKVNESYSYYLVMLAGVRALIDAHIARET